MIGYLIGLAVSGLIIGALGRLANPGRQPMGCFMTVLVGIGGSFLGGLVGEALFNRPGGFILAVLCSAAIVFVISRVSR
ncbi:MAG: hypothetical protein K0R11_883 [Acidimicrobiales bacterium]|nr:hypothetical protein [Acidimicrobiales bacterium]